MRTNEFLEKYGPWAVVTGASDGIGREFATQVAARGLNVVLVARRADRLRELATALAAEHSIAAKVVAADLSDAAGRKLVLDATSDLDVGLLVAAAGYGTSGPILSAAVPTERNLLEVNCYAVLEQCMSFGKRFAQRGRGGLILLGSLVGWQGVPNAAHYAATKAYVQSLAEALRVEWAPLGVNVLACAPGPVTSGFGERADMRIRSGDSPATVAKATLQALGRRGTVIPGALGKLLTYSLALLPRALRIRIMGQIMAGMTRHHAHA
jgi:short-subunit dehydrogenase